MHAGLIKGQLRLLQVLLASITIVALSNYSLAAPVAYAQPWHSTTELKEATFTLDNVEVNIRTPFLPSTSFGVASSGNSKQVADSSSPNPLRDLEVIAAPFGYIPGSESSPENPLPSAAHGLAPAYRGKLRQYRIAMGGNPQPGPSASLFGAKVTSDVSLLEAALITPDKEPTLFVDWVVEAGPRLWIVRIVAQLPDGTKDLSGQAAFLSSLESLTLTSNNLDNPSTLKPAYPPATSVIPGMPKTGAMSAWEYRLPTLLVALFSGIVLLGGFYLRRKSGFCKKL